MGREMLGGVRFSRVEKDGREALVRETVVEVVERWRRQRAVWSGQRTKLDEQVALVPK